MSNQQSRLRVDEYRDALELWTDWWNGPGREHYRFYLLPPLNVTEDTLRCTACHDVGPDEVEDGQRCEVCARRLA